MLYTSPSSTTPWSISQEMKGQGLEGVAFAIMTATVETRVQVAEQVDSADAFTAGFSYGGSTTSTTSTGTALATTRPQAVVVGPNRLSFPMRVAVVGPTRMADYRQAWACTLNGTSVYSGALAPSGDIGAAAALTLGSLEALQCTVTLTPKAHLTLQKVVDNTNGGAAVATDWTLTATAGTDVISGVSGVKKAVHVGDAYALSEVPSAADKGIGYELKGWTCTPAPATTASTVTIPAAGGDIVCTATNASKPGALTWNKADTSGKFLADSVWILAGPSGTIEVTDCVAQGVDACANMRDVNPGAGAFAVTGLKWGTYTLAETTAPAGFILDTTQRTSPAITGAALTQGFGTISNTAITPPALPLTGGHAKGGILLVGGGVLGLAVILGAWTSRRRARA